MKYRRKILKEDKQIDKKIRQVGIRETARRVGLSEATISYLLSGERVTSEKNYRKIKNVIMK